MSGKFDMFAIKKGLVKEEDVQKEYKLRLCKDRTLSITKGKQKPFNGVAIAVLSFDTLKEAKDFVTFIGKKQWNTLYGSDELDKKKLGVLGWHKFFPGMEVGNLEFDDIPRQVEQMKIALNSMLEFKTKRKAAREEMRI